MFDLMLDYALEHDLVTKNYARTFELSNDIVKEKEEAKRGHINFNDSEMDSLWKNIDNIKFTDWILIQCYMGWRPQEMGLLRLEDVDPEKWCITGGMKTDAGRHRTVPIHTCIRELVKRNYDESIALGSDRLFNDPDSPKGGMKITYDKYASRFDKVVVSLQLRSEHRPHDPRTTFITMAKKAGVDEYVVKRLAGHKITDVTEAVYTIRDIEWLRDEIEKMPGPSQTQSISNIQT